MARRRMSPQDSLWLEIDRSTYLARDGATAATGFDVIARLIEELAAKLGDAISARQIRDAAE